MRSSISKQELFLSLLFNGINTITWISYTLYYSIRGEELGTFIYLTMITWNFNSIYLFLNLVCDVHFYFNLKKLEPLNDFLRNKLCNVINTMSIIVTILYWTLLCIGGVPAIVDFLDFLSNFYFHFLISALVILDIFIANHRRHRFSYITLCFCYVYLVCYFIYGSVLTWVFDKPPYPFMTEPYYIVIIYAAVFCVVLALCYLFLVSLYTIKYKYILKIEGDEEEINIDENLGDGKKLTPSQENEKSE